ncbi:hypothetical protein PR202_gb14156 [Eleusine coracana subsp. coracana]|uniref:Uncharacterized protein n=1 Tax=Eleusine coracana subsp. coracana TaxID=191504 RepID=A0AAV5ETX6_ELECO|nr:hypothetical protein PR202_gb14156 [Eleusine coracana subsp. coracana]
MEVTMHVVDVAGHALAVVERDGTHDPATGRALTGSWLWDSSLVLASHLARLRVDELRGATVLELGAGSTGLPGIAAVACLGAARCVLTDVAGPLLPGLRANAAANGLDASRADVRELRWGDRLELEPEEEERVVGVVLMSDVFYDPEDMPAMAATLRGMWRDGVTVGWAASEVRDGVRECMDVLRDHGVDVAEVHRVVQPLLRDPDQSAVFAVYRLSLRQQETTSTHQLF